MVSTLRTPTGVRIRHIRPADLERLEAFYAGLSADSLRARFHGASHGIPDDVARQFCRADHRRDEGFVAVVGDGVDEIIVGHLCLEPGRAGDLEMAIAVADAWQHRGIGRALVDAGIAWSVAHGVTRMHATILWSNPAIVGLLRSIRRPITFGVGPDGEPEAVVSLGGVPAPVVPAAA
jgi:GNAT superfamily N-acetyltransferase